MSTISKKTIREQSEEIWSEIHEAMLYVLEQEVPPAIMKADLQQEVVTELERLRNLNTYDNEVLWYNALVAGNFIQKTIDGMGKIEPSQVDRRQWGEFLLDCPKEVSSTSGVEEEEEMSEDEIIDVLFDELWTRLPNEPYPEQIEFVLLEAAMQIEEDEGIYIKDNTLQKVLNEYNTVR